MMSERITQAVKSKYGSVATSGLSSNQGGVKAVAEAFGYTPEELASIPAEANMGLSCGNPTAFASLREGEMIVDLGSGGGLDVLLAARKVGPRGKAIGIDMTPEMIDLARANAVKSGLVEYRVPPGDDRQAATGRCHGGLRDLQLRHQPGPGQAGRLPGDLRVLKPGGRLAISDIALKRELPAEIGDDLMAHVGCIAGAILIEDYRRMLTDAGFAHVEIIDSGKDLNAYAKVENQAACCSASVRGFGPALSVAECCAAGETSFDSVSGQLPRQAGRPAPPL